jgi:hypothetical protein
MSFHNRPSQYSQPQQRFVATQAKPQMQVRTSNGQVFGISKGAYNQNIVHVPLHIPKPAPKPQLNVMFVSPGRGQTAAQQTGLMLSPTRNTMQFPQSPARVQQVQSPSHMQHQQQSSQQAFSPRRYVALSPNSRAQQAPQMQQQQFQQTNFRR